MRFGKLYTEATKWNIPYVPPKRLSRVQDWVYEQMLASAIQMRYGKKADQLSDAEYSKAIEMVTQESMKSSLRNKGNKAIEKVLPVNTYFKEVPITQIQKALFKVGLVILQEDFTEWSGMLLGKQGKMNVPVAPTYSGSPVHGVEMYTPFTNTQFVLTWYKMESGSYETIAYLA